MSGPLVRPLVRPLVPLGLLNTLDPHVSAHVFRSVGRDAANKGKYTKSSFWLEGVVPEVEQFYRSLCRLSITLHPHVSGTAGDAGWPVQTNDYATNIGKPLLEGRPRFSVPGHAQQARSCY